MDLRKGDSNRPQSPLPHTLEPTVGEVEASFWHVNLAVFNRYLSDLFLEGFLGMIFKILVQNVIFRIIPHFRDFAEILQCGKFGTLMKCYQNW